MLKFPVILSIIFSIINASPTCDIKKLEKCEKLIEAALPKGLDHASIKLVIRNTAELAGKSKECNEVVKNCPGGKNSFEDLLFQELTPRYPLYQFVASNYFIECALNYLEDVQNYKQFIPICKNLALILDIRNIKKCEVERSDLEKCSEAIFGKYCTMEHAKNFVEIFMKTMNDEKQCRIIRNILQNHEKYN